MRCIISGVIKFANDSLGTPLGRILVVLPTAPAAAVPASRPVACMQTIAVASLRTIGAMVAPPTRSGYSPEDLDLVTTTESCHPYCPAIFRLPSPELPLEDNENAARPPPTSSPSLPSSSELSPGLPGKPPKVCPSRARSLCCCSVDAGMPSDNRPPLAKTDKP